MADAGADAAVKHPRRQRRLGLEPSRPTRYGLRFVALLYVGLLVLLPLGTVLWRTFENGVGPVWEAINQPDVWHAFRLTALVAILSVIINTIFGVGMALLLVRTRFPGRQALDFLLDLPLSVSPIVVGLALILVYGKNGWFGGALGDAGIQVIFATPGMVLATVFVSLPLVLREVMPVLREVGIEQEQAAQSLGASALQRFRRITLPTIKWAVAYGLVLSLARSLGEFGAVKVVSGNLLNRTQTATLVVEQKYQDFEQPAAYAIAFVLVFVAIIAIVIISIIRPKEDR
ncbi:MAG: sulfate transporter, inner rane subunit [Pseudonocardiales bacterium]|nr:sulfate transporter, inner rane subunit [Pseudonocardiales bacterium]